MVTVNARLESSDKSSSASRKTYSNFSKYKAKVDCINQNKFAYTVSLKLLSRDYKTY